VKEMKNKNLLVVILVIGIGVGGFFAGMKYQQNKQPSRAGFQGMRGTRQPEGLGGQQREGSRMIRGEIIGQDEEGVTIKLPDESSKIILISEKTTINKATEGSKDDLESGKQIVVFGQENSDKSISATNIQLDFGFGGGMQGGSR
jgi:hypothetical protein